MDKKLKRELEMQAIRIRMDVIKGTFNAKSGHPGGSLSISDIMAYLYFHKMNVDPQNPDWEDRDRFVLSKGHTAPALYGALALKGFFPESEIERLRKPTSYLQGHPSLRLTPGVDMSTGSLGQGISAAVGMALAAKLKNKDYQVYTVLGDGEIQEGQVWEAAMFAAAKKLDNLVAVVDNNNLQIDGTIEERSTLRTPSTRNSKRSAGTSSTATATTSTRSTRRSRSRTRRMANPPSSSQRPSRAKAFPTWNTLWNGTARLPSRRSMMRR